MKTLLIDNYDSFTFNLFQLIAQVSGVEPYVVKNNEHDWEYLSRLDYDNIVISPGPGRPDNPRDFGVCSEAILKSDRPLLGVCLGHQGIWQLFGGAIRRAPQVMHGRLSRVYHGGGELFRGIPSPFVAMRYHSLAAADPPPEALEVTARTNDGVIMALRHKSRPIWGVQFHPESICTEYGRALMANFRALTERRQSATAAPAAPRPDTPGRATGSHRTPLRGNELRVSVRKLNYYREPESVFCQWLGDSRPAFWLDSSLIAEGLSRFSFMGELSPGGALVSYNTHTETIAIQGGGTRRTARMRLFDFLSQELAQSRIAGEPPPFGFTGGYVGYLGYELKRECGAAFAHHSPYPDALLMFADRIIAFDHKEHSIYLVAIGPAGSVPEMEDWFAMWQARLDGPPRGIASMPESKYRLAGDDSSELRVRHSPRQYLALIEECQRHIHEGESYEICLTNMLSVADAPDPLATYRILRSISPAPYSAFLRFPGITILSSSPERFVSVDRRGNAESKPIKGTIRRGRTAEEDRALAETLRTSEKERAENLMIVDLVRNDLGAVSEIGSVRVPKLAEIETYATVHHLVSTVTGRLKTDATAVDCVRAMFPGGSMTGAPKLRTMEIIDQLEGAARGIYSGALGYFGLDGSVDLGMTIRTIVLTPHRAEFGSGGAIVAMSDPVSEAEEVLLKAKALIRAISIVRQQPPEVVSVLANGVKLGLGPA